MKDFAKSIVCNTKAGNSFGNTLLSWSEKALIAKGQYEDAKNPKEKQYIKEYAQRDYQWLKNNMSRVKDPEELKDIQKAISVYQKIGNSRVGNAYQYAGNIPIEKIPDNWRPEFPKAGYVVYYAPNKAKWFATEAEAKRFAESQDKAQKNGNSKVGNANTHLTASNSGELWLNFDGTGEMYDPIELGRYDFSGKSEALSVARELEQLKRKAEQRVKDADKFINAIKQWAAGLK